MVQGFRFRSVRASGTLQRRPRHRGLKGGGLKADGWLQPMPFSRDDRGRVLAVGWHLGAVRADIVSEEEPHGGAYGVAVPPGQSDAEDK